eukprot:scaffold15570_cov51-Cyclotella_meneghiniana.AAC.4
MICNHTVPYSSFPSLALMLYVPIGRQKSSNIQSVEVQDLSSTANALISSRLDRTAYEAIVRQQPRCNMQLNRVDEMQAKDGAGSGIGSGVEKNDIQRINVNFSASKLLIT